MANFIMSGICQFERGLTVERISYASFVPRVDDHGHHYNSHHAGHELRTVETSIDALPRTGDECSLLEAT